MVPPGVAAKLADLTGGSLVTNFMVFADLIAERHYDLVIADEAWDIDHFLHENPELKTFAYAWLTDFVGWLLNPTAAPTRPPSPPTTTWK